MKLFQVQTIIFYFMTVKTLYSHQDQFTLTRLSNPVRPSLPALNLFSLTPKLFLN